MILNLNNVTKFVRLTSLLGNSMYDDARRVIFATIFHPFCNFNGSVEMSSENF